MKALYLILGLVLLMCLLYGCAAVQFAAVGTALGWVWYEDKKVKEARR